MIDLKTRQAELEYESVMLGQARYDRERADQDESATGPGAEQTSRNVDALAGAIVAFIEASSTSAGRHHNAVAYLTHINPRQAAYLAIRYAIDGAAGRQKITTVALKLGAAIEDHINLVNLNDEAPGLYFKVMQQLRFSTSEHHRSTVQRHVTRKYDKSLLTWTDYDKVTLGVKLIELFDEVSNIVTSQRISEGHHNTPIRLVFTPEAQAWFDSAHANAREWAPIHQPMVFPPRDWVDAFDGGYLSRAMHRATLVPQLRLKSSVGGAAFFASAEQLQAAYNAVNAVQRTPWHINKSVLDVVRQAHTSGPAFQALLSEDDQALPARPGDLPSEGVKATEFTASQREVFSLWKRECAEVYQANARLRSKRISATQKMWVAEKFAEFETIYFPHYLDFRGRIYPYASYLNPQSDDLGRGLLEFAEGKPLGSRGLYWLKIQIANLFGIDKVSFEERIKWVEANMDALLDSAMSPLDGQKFWTTADGGGNKWQALAACFELAGAMVQGESYVSHLPIAMDGSCSGLQHYSAMLRDPVGGAAVNLVPQAKPGDIYTAVAKRAQALSDGSTSEMVPHWRGRVKRSIAKRPTMTVCYAATLYGMQSQIAGAVNDEGGSDFLDGADVRSASMYMARHIWDAIGETVVAAKDAMAFLKDCATVCNDAAVDIKWTTPAGFLAKQAYRVDAKRLVNIHYKGQRMQLKVAVDTKKRDTKKQVSGIAPNFVHSLDSAHLMATVTLGSANGLDHWACIHDSFGVHAADVDTLHACIREAFIDQYTPDVLARFRTELAAQLPAELAANLPAVPKQGTLELAAVRESQYFFA